mmetsp:Transcript_71451/g.155181  ORF Transcript_71451/g.155181 Transcript_71451/m.155181 type:complete len:231 (-) Transcript_71451:1311-2003(-)
MVMKRAEVAPFLYEPRLQHALVLGSQLLGNGQRLLPGTIFEGLHEIRVRQSGRQCRLEDGLQLRLLRFLPFNDLDGHRGAHPESVGNLAEGAFTYKTHQPHVHERWSSRLQLGYRLQGLSTSLLRIGLARPGHFPEEFRVAVRLRDLALKLATAHRDHGDEEKTAGGSVHLALLPLRARRNRRCSHIQWYLGRREAAGDRHCHAVRTFQRRRKAENCRRREKPLLRELRS